jgi:hypothetical protein
MAVNVGVRELQSSAKRHADVALSIKTSSSSSLLLVYAAECGLKAALMKRTSIRDTSLLREDLRTHSLRKLARELRLPPVIDLNSLRCAHKSDKSSYVDDHELHQAWRYGRDLKGDDEVKAHSVLLELLVWCEQEAGVTGR